MQTWITPEQQPSVGAGGSVLTIGTFDGVHRGHQVLMAQVVREAEERNATSMVLTFDPHPMVTLFPERAPAQLMRVQERLDAIAATGIDATWVIPFTREFAATAAEDFVRDTLVGRLKMKAIVVGADMRFGHKNAGDVALLQKLGPELGFEVLIVEDQGQGDVVRWSSTAVRAAIAEGEMGRAHDILGRPHATVGTVVHGDHRGREIGYPTANLAAEDLLAVPLDGIYAGYLTVLEPAGDDGEHPQQGIRMPAAISVGTNPTFDGVQRRVESYVLDHGGPGQRTLDLYGCTVKVEFTHFLRPTLKFDSLEELLAQMDLDVAQCASLTTDSLR